MVQSDERQHRCHARARDVSCLFRYTNDVNGQDKHRDEKLRELVVTSVMKTKHRPELKKPG
jgi:hypothetical protein